MPEQLQKILDRVVEWWKKFSNKQRMLLISLTAVVILALVILGVVVSRPSYTTLIDCQNAKEASQVKDLLDGEGDIDYKVTDTTHFEVNQAYSVARLVATALGNDSTDKITILDQKTSKILFSGADQDDDATVVSDSLDIKDRIKNSVVNGIKDVMVKSGMYSDVQVAPNLDIDMSKVEKAVQQPLQA